MKMSIFGVIAVIVVGCVSVVAQVRGALVTYEVLGPVTTVIPPPEEIEILESGVNGGPNQRRLASTFMGQMIRVVFTYDTEAFQTEANSDGLEFLTSLAYGFATVGGDLVSRFSFFSVVFSTGSSSRFQGMGPGYEFSPPEPLYQGIFPNVSYDVGEAMRSDGRILPPGGSIGPKYAGVSMFPFLSVGNDATLREVVPEPSVALLLGGGGLVGLARRRKGAGREVIDKGAYRPGRR